MPNPESPAEPDLSNDKPEHFQTPEEVAFTDKPETKPPEVKNSPKKWWQDRLTKKQTIIVAVIAGLLIIGLGTFILTRSHKPSSAQPQSAAKPVSAPIVSPLTGLTVTEAATKRPVTAVMIENSDFARPQSGLSQAGVVFEAIAEAGITRFMALYQEAKPVNIGPIRSVRPYYLQWAIGFDAPVAHVGGSPEALADIKTWKVKNLDEFYYGSYYHRINTREAPHNVYTSMADLNAIEKLNHWTHSTFVGFPRKKESPVKSHIVSNIHFNISSADFYDVYQYDAKDNAYLRWEGGAKHVDAKTGKQLEPKVVIGIVVPYSLESDGYHSDYKVIGSGKAYVFQDGRVTIGTWTKKTMTSQIKFTHAGETIKLNAGQTWITALGTASELQYSQAKT